jgi:Methyltransferase domain
MTAAVKSFYDIPGWFRWLDMTMFHALLDAQSDSAPGVLVELGTYLGKSSVVIGDHLRDGDRFVAVDLFGDTDILGESAADVANRRESTKSYGTLTRRTFEENYLALHTSLPDIVQGPSSEIVNHVEPATARFVHVDASHMYAHVAVDVANARTLMRPGGLVVFDDYRGEHTPGVAAAVWAAVTQDGLIPVALTTQKFYGVYDDAEPYASVLRTLFAGDERYQWETQQIMGRDVLRARMVQPPRQPAPPPPPPAVDVHALSADLAGRLAPMLRDAVRRPAVEPKTTATARARRLVSRRLSNGAR